MPWATLANIEAFWKLRAGPPEVDKVIAQQDPINLRVVMYVVFVGLPIRTTVVRVGL